MRKVDGVSLDLCCFESCPLTAISQYGMRSRYPLQKQSPAWYSHPFMNCPDCNLRWFRDASRRLWTTHCGAA